MPDDDEEWTIPRRKILAGGLAVPISGCLAKVDDLNPASSDAGPRSPDEDFRNPRVETTGRTREFDLYLRTDDQQVSPNINIPVWGFSFDESGETGIPGPEFRVTEGDRVKINFHNTHPTAHTIHWHGLHVPHGMDGVPFISQEPIPSGSTFTYDFIARPSGTFWYHCHVDAPHHIDMGMYGAFVIEPQADDREEKEVPFDREHTLIFDEIDKDHNHNFNQFIERTDPTNNPSGNPYYQKETADQTLRDTPNNPPGTGPDEPSPLAEERDWYPNTHPPFDPGFDTALLNGYAFPYSPPFEVAEGERVKLRLINVGAEDKNFHVHGHSFWVTHKDGYKLEHPYRADTLPMSPGERYDLLIDADNPGVWAMHDHYGKNTSNHKIYPGGIFTVLAYEQFADQTPNEMPNPDTGEMTAGSFLRHYQ